MLLRSKHLLFPAYTNLTRRLLSNKIKEVLNSRLELPKDYNTSHLQLNFVSKNLNALNLDLFVNNLSEHEDKSSVVLDLLASLRSTKLANTCLESTHFAVVRHLLENLPIQEVVPVLLDRLKYGIFLNNFTSFAVFQRLNDEKEYILGLPLALKLILSEEVDNRLVKGFLLKASLETLKKELSGDQSVEDKFLNQPKGKVQEIKVRVKFLRNVEEPDLYSEIGKAILKVQSSICLEENATANAKILGLVLSKKYAELNKELQTSSLKIYRDVADISKKLLARENQTDFVSKFDNMQSNVSFECVVDEFLKTSIEEADVLADWQKQLLPLWLHVRDKTKLEIEKETEKIKRKENVEVIENEIATKKDLLWFFDQEDKHDLEIFKKQVFYPKRWFGKKKKPRVVDEHYVPPQIRKIN